MNGILITRNYFILWKKAEGGEHNRPCSIGVIGPWSYRPSIDFQGCDECGNLPELMSKQFSHY